MTICKSFARSCELSKQRLDLLGISVPPTLFSHQLQIAEFELMTTMANLNLEQSGDHENAVGHRQRRRSGAQPLTLPGTLDLSSQSL